MVAPVVVIAAPLVYEDQFVPPSMLKRYSSAAPVEPPVPAAPVTAPVLKPAQIVLPLAGVAELNVGAVGVEATVQVEMVLHAEAEQP